MVFWFFSKKRIDKRIDELHVNMADSFKNLKKDMNGTVQWIEHFKTKHEAHDENIKSLHRRVNSLEEAYNELRDSLNVKGSVRTFMNVRTDDLISPINVENEPSDRSRPFMNVRTFMNVATVENLTAAQRNIVAFLIYSAEPMGYDDIAKKLGLSEVTIRRHISDMRRFGFKIYEKVSVKSRKKLFYFDEKSKKEIVTNK